MKEKYYLIILLIIVNYKKLRNIRLWKHLMTVSPWSVAIVFVVLGTFDAAVASTGGYCR